MSDPSLAAHIEELERENAALLDRINELTWETT
jgi:hypothetical protein